MKRLPVPVRLAILPLTAAIAVVFIAGISLVDLKKRHLKSEASADPEALQVLRRPQDDPVVPRSNEVQRLSEAEALGLLEESPTRAVLLRLWPETKHRARLFDFLLKPEATWDLRLYLLGRFETESPREALAAARSIAKEKSLEPGPLLLSVYEILSRQGEGDDLALLAERPHEPHQVKTRREEYRERLEQRARK